MLKTLPNYQLIWLLANNLFRSSDMVFLRARNSESRFPFVDIGALIKKSTTDSTHCIWTTTHDFSYINLLKILVLDWM